MWTLWNWYLGFLRLKEKPDQISYLSQEASRSVQQQAAVLPGKISSKDAPALQRFQRPSQHLLHPVEPNPAATPTSSQSTELASLAPGGRLSLVVVFLLFGKPLSSLTVPSLSRFTIKCQKKKNELCNDVSSSCAQKKEKRSSWDVFIVRCWIIVFPKIQIGRL